jgi:hypothetical protein
MNTQSIARTPVPQLRVGDHFLIDDRNGRTRTAWRINAINVCFPGRAFMISNGQSKQRFFITDWRTLDRVEDAS